MKIRLLMGIALFAFAVPSWVRADDAAVAEASAVVRGFTDAMLATLKEAETVNFDGRYAHLVPAVEKAFDIDFMSEKSLGDVWATLKPEQKTQWRQLFLKYTASNYASRLNKFSGQSFEQVGQEPGPSDTLMIQTKVIDPGAENVDLNYRLRKTEAGWKIIDIYLKGTVSEIALRRSDYVTVAKSQGFEALVTHLGKKIADMADGKPG